MATTVINFDDDKIFVPDFYPVYDDKNGPFLVAVHIALGTITPYAQTTYVLPCIANINWGTPWKQIQQSLLHQISIELINQKSYPALRVPHAKVNANPVPDNLLKGAVQVFLDNRMEISFQSELPPLRLTPKNYRNVLSTMRMRGYQDIVNVVLMLRAQSLDRTLGEPEVQISPDWDSFGDYFLNPMFFLLKFVIFGTIIYNVGDILFKIFT